MNKFISFDKALDLTLTNISVMKTEGLSLDRLSGRVLAESVVSTLDNPSLDISLKDGYAVVSEDLEQASDTNKIKLTLIGSATAGNLPEYRLTRGRAIRVTTGAPIPQGASAVLSEEFSEQIGNQIICFNTAEPGRNILYKGTDIKMGETVAEKGTLLTPAFIGLLASAGRTKAIAYKPPEIAVIATGDEVVAPGAPLSEGKLYASNMVSICAWLTIYGIPFHVEVVNDKKEEIREAIAKHLPHVDAFVTSGGIRGSETDLMPEVLQKLQWKLVYHGIRMGPGKGTGFGLLEKRPFFSLPGGPPSNETAFLELALPALMKMKGEARPPFTLVRARLTEEVKGNIDWTQYIHARLSNHDGKPVVNPLRLKSRLLSMAQKNALIILPEGCDKLAAGEEIEVQVIR